MWKTRFSAALFLIAAIASGDDLRTIDGREYKHVTINRVETDGILITHSAGVAKIPFTEHPKDVQERFGYDAVKIEAERAAAKSCRRQTA